MGYRIPQAPIEAALAADVRAQEAPRKRKPPRSTNTCRIAAWCSSAMRSLVAQPLHPFAHGFAIPSHAFRFFACPPFRRLLVSTVLFHFPKQAFALQLLLEHAHSAINVIVSNEYLHVTSRA